MPGSESTRSVNLRQVVVRPIRPAERARWEQLLEQHHYLGCRPLVGEAMRYVALEGTRWLALLSWTTGAFKCAPRDRFIGWAPRLQFARLAWIANNARFLILPGARVPNLASRVLALNLRRLSADWRERYDHGIALAETFVDPQRFSGTCYRAAGWRELGETRGFARRAGRYVAHGVKKRLWVRVVDPRLFSRLADPDPGPELPPARPSGGVMPISATQADGLWQALLSLPDPRSKQGQRHSKTSILALAVCAVLGGARTVDAIAQAAKLYPQSLLKRFNCWFSPRTQRYKAPSEPTFRRFLRTVEPEALEKVLGRWLSEHIGDDDVLAIDGKTLRGARRADGSVVRLLAAFSTTSQVVLAQREIPPETNEIPVAHEVLEELPLEGKTVVADALHTQKELAQKVVGQGADYCFVVKDNQPQLREDIATYFRSAAFPPSARNH